MRNASAGCELKPWLGLSAAPEIAATVASGTPEEVAKVARSYTGHYLKPLLKAAAPAKRLKAAE